MTNDDLPTLSQPIARGASRCHVLAVRDGVGTMVAACGIACGGFCGDQSYAEGTTSCAVHDEPLCPECIAIVAELERTGDWHGAEQDQGSHTVCFEPGCGALVLVGGCWCFEHLNVCQEQDCEHGAHLCDAPVHYCAEHRRDPE